MVEKNGSRSIRHCCASNAKSTETSTPSHHDMQKSQCAMRDTMRPPRTCKRSTKPHFLASVRMNAVNKEASRTCNEKSNNSI